MDVIFVDVSQLLCDQSLPNISVTLVFSKYTRLAILALLPTLYSHIFAVCCFIGTFQY